MGIFSLFNDPIPYITGLLLSLPGILLALSGHEAAHGFVANRCGDPTARLMGRVTLNPMKHIDPVGFFCMLFVGFGWARPVPVNPQNFQHSRRDDLKVSLAGICANLIMCLIGFLFLMALFSLALSRVPVYDDYARFIRSGEELARFSMDGETLYMARLEAGNIYLRADDLFKAASGIWSFSAESGAYLDITDMLIAPALGTVARYAYQMISSFMMINLALAVFNLIPVPPLDGYHVLNDLLLKRPLFAPQKAARIGTAVLFGLIMLGNFNEKLDVISIALTFVRQTVFDGMTRLAYLLSNALNLL